MAKASEVSDSEESKPAATSIKQTSPNKVKETSVEVESEAENGEDSEVEEYEIEEIRDAKRGYFPGGRIGYLVKWKGYAESENSWVDEADAENAGDLVKEFWQRRERVKGPRKGGDDKTKSPKRSRKSVAAEDGSDAAAATTTAPKKRGRKSVTKEDSDVDMDKDKPESASARVTKKARKTITEKSADKPNRKAQATASTRTASPIPVDGDEVAVTMAKYMNQDSWEDLVTSVDTVERVGQELYIYFSLSTGEHVREVSTLCKKRFPQKLLDFYEGNLRWRTAEDA